MRKIIETKINRFDGGLSEDKRVKIPNKFSITKHFDIFTYPHKLLPYHKTEAEEDKTYNIVKFLYAPRTFSGDIPLTFNLFGLGVVGGAGSETKAKVYLNSLDFSTGWEIPTNNASALANRNTEVFFYYKGYIYMWANSAKLIRFDVTSGGAFDDAYQSIAYTNVAQPVHHPSDDIAYFFQDNVVHKLNGTNWTSSVLTLPANLKIVSVCPYGNYLAIGCVELDLTHSIVYLWDRDSSLATLTERIDFGEGEIRHLANLNNRLIAVMNFYMASSGSLDRGKILIKTPSGLFAETLNEIILDDTLSASEVLPKTRMVKDNKLYFPTKATLNGDSRFGIWVVDENGKMTVDFVEEEATSYEGIYSWANIWFVAHSADGSVNRSATPTGPTFSTTLASIYESLIFNTGDSDLTKELIGVTVMTEKLPAAGQIILKYRKDGATAWKTIFVYGTDNSLSHGALFPESRVITMSIATPAVVTLTSHGLVAGDKIRFTTTGALPTGVTAETTYYVISAGLATDSFRFSASSGGSAVNTSGTQSGVHTLHFIDGFGEHKEIEFRIESTGGAVITGLKFKEELKDRSLY